MENQRIRYKVIDIKTDEKKNTITLSVKNEAEKLYSSTMPSYEVDFDIQPLYIFGRPPQGRSNRVKYYGHLCTENFDYLKIGEIYRFIVVDLYDTKSGTKYAVVIDDKGNNHSVKLLEWQKNVNLQQKIPCRVDKILEDRVRLSQDIPNLKHPYLIEGRKYLFAIEDVSIIESDYFTVTDSKGNSHRTYISRELVREIKEKKGNFIHLYFTGLSKAGELQLNYFNSFHDIIPFRFLKQNVFDSLFEKEFKTDTEEKIIQDYNCFDNRWVLTYANYLNSEIKHKLFNEESLESAYLSCEVYKRLEEWIVSSNYLKLFSENKSKDIKKTANNEIVRINRLIEAIDLIQIEQDLFYVEYSNDEWSKYFSICILIFEYYLKKEDAIVSHKESLFCFYKKAIEQKLEKYQYTEINRVLDRHAYIITKSGKLDAVSFNTSSIETYADNESVDRLCKIMHFQIILGVSESNNIVYICSKILAIINCYSKLVKEQSHRTNLLNNGVRFFGHLLMSSTNTSIVNKIRSSIDYKAILEIVTSTEVYNSDVGVARYQSNAILEIPKTISTSENVLIGNLDGTLCFVNSKSSLSKNISKNSRLLYVDSSNGVLCLAETVESVGAKDIAELIEGDQYKAIVKSIVEYGIFVRVGQYEGLIHKSKISPIRTNKITGLFSIGEELDVVLSSIKSVNEGAEVNYNFSRKVVKSYEKDFKRISKNKLYKVKIFSIDKYRGIEFEFIDFNIRGHLDKRELDLGRDYEELFRIGEILDVHYVQKKELITGDFVAVCKVNVSKIASTPSKMSVRPLSISKVEGYQWLIKKREVICQNCYSKNNNINILEISNNILICEKCNISYENLVVFYTSFFNKIFLLSIENDNYLHKKIIQERIEIGRNIDVNCVNDKDNNGNHFAYSDKLEYINEDYYRALFYQIGFLYETLSSNKIDILETKNLAQIAGYFYGLARSKRSYYFGVFYSFFAILDKYRNAVEKTTSVSLEKALKEIYEDMKSLLNNEVANMPAEGAPQLKSITNIIKAFISLEDKTDTASALLDVGDEENIINLVEYYKKIPIRYKSMRFVVEFHDVLRKAVDEYVNITSPDITDHRHQENVHFIERCIEDNENEKLEFKASIIVPHYTIAELGKIVKIDDELKKATSPEQKKKLNTEKKKIVSNVTNPNKDRKDIVKLALAKAMAGLANKRGGDVIVGLGENHLKEIDIIGIEKDIADAGGKDELLQRLDSIVSEKISNSFHQTVSAKFIRFRTKELLRITISESDSIIWIKDKNNAEEACYVRGVASTRKLVGKDLEILFKEKSKRVSG